MLGSLTNEQIVSRSATTPAAVSGSFFLLYNAACLYLENFGVRIIQSVDSLTIEDLDPLLNSVGQLFVAVAEGISKVILVDEDDTNIGMSLHLPPVLPCELAQIDMRMFAKLIQNHCLHLVTNFNDSGLEQISQEFCKFQCSFHEEGFKEALELTDNDATSIDFKKLWLQKKICFPQFQCFCRGLASAFPNTAEVESDFSINGWEKSDDWNDLTDFSLEGILHTKPYNDLKKLNQDLY